MRTNEIHDTYPKLLVEQARKLKYRTAMREKVKGVWKEISWLSYLERVRHLALGLESMGLK